MAGQIDGPLWVCWSFFDERSRKDEADWRYYYSLRYKLKLIRTASKMFCSDLPDALDARSSVKIRKENCAVPITLAE